MIQFAADTPTLTPPGRPAPPPVTGGDATFAALLAPGAIAAQVASVAPPVSVAVAVAVAPLPTDAAFAVPAATDPEGTMPFAAQPGTVDLAPLADATIPASDPVVAGVVQQAAPDAVDPAPARPVPRRFASAADVPLSPLRPRPDGAADPTDRQSDAGDGKDAPPAPTPDAAATPLAIVPTYPPRADIAPVPITPTRDPATAIGQAAATVPPAGSTAVPPRAISVTAASDTLTARPIAEDAPVPTESASTGVAPAAGSIDATQAVLSRRREPRVGSDAAGGLELAPSREHGAVPTDRAPTGSPPSPALSTAPAAAPAVPIPAAQAGRSDATNASSPVHPATILSPSLATIVADARPTAAPVTAPLPVPIHWTMAPAATTRPADAVATPSDAARLSTATASQPSALQVASAPPTPGEAARLAPAAASLAAQVLGPARSRPAAERIDTDAGAIATPTATVPIALAVVAAPQPAPTIDVRHERWPHDMIGQIERLRDAADAVDTRIRLLPDRLGSVEVDVRCEGDTLHVRFQAEQPQTRALLQEAQPRLAEAAEQRGLKLGQASVDAGTGNAPGQERDRPHTPNPRQPSRPASSRAAGPEPTDDARIA